MSKQSKVNVDLEKLKSLYESLKSRPHVEVGVFAAKTSRDDNMTNATLASIHEYGAPEHGLPARSILDVPIRDHREEIMSYAKTQGEAIVTKYGAMRLWKLLGVGAEKVITQAFQTGGFGKWAPIKYATLLAKLKGSLSKRKKMIAQISGGQASSGILIASRQLSKSFSSRVRMSF